MHAADPPSPLPRWLHPLRGALGADDLCIVLSRRELDAIAAALRALELDDAQLRIVARDGSPWIELDVVTVSEHLDAPFGELVRVVLEQTSSRRLALWRYTCAVYELDEHGAVPDEPIWRPIGKLER